MPLSPELRSVSGAQELHDWFGFWPSFHDAEIVRLHLNRNGPSHLTVHTWRMTKRINSQGHYESEKHVVVEFVLDDVFDLRLDGFSHQNVILSLTLEKIETGFRLTLSPCYGLSGKIEAERISIRLATGLPADSTNAPTAG